MEESKTPSEARRVVPRGWGLGRGAVAPPVWGSGGIAPENFEIEQCKYVHFFHDFKTEIALPSVVFHSFTAYICSYHLRQKYALHFATSHNTLQQSTAHLTKSTAHFVSENTQF